jgi:RNA polymerase sigma-70 factor (family 1)
MPPSESPQRDRAWWSAIRTGDAAAFEDLFRQHAADLHNFALSYVRSPDVAEELVHQLFCWVWDHRHTLEEPQTIRGYLFTAIRNRARNHTRDEQARAAFLSRVAAGEAPIVGSIPATDSAALTSDLEVAIDRAIAELPRRCHEVFILIRKRRMTYTEAAAILEIAPKTVEIHMGRALKILRIKLAPWLNGGS